MEILFSLAIMAFLGIMLALSAGLQGERLEGDVLGSSGFPVIVIGIGMLLCALLILKQLKDRRSGTTPAARLIDLSSPSGRAVALSAAVLAGYLAIMNIAGFIVATFAFIAVSAAVMGYRSYGKLFAFSAIGTAALFGLFGKVFFVPLPRGVGLLRELSYLLY